MTHSLRGLDVLVEELETSLGLAREALVTFQTGPEDTSPLSFALGCLHQVSGSLSMAQCYGALFFAGEMEAVLKMLLLEPGVGAGSACRALELAMQALPSYVQNLLNGCDDSLAQLMGQVNELRAVRAEPLMSATSLFMPQVALSETLASSDVDYEMLGKLQKVYQYALLGYLKQQDLAANQQKIAAVLQRLQVLFNTSSLESLWRVASAFFFALVERHIRQSAATRTLLWELDKTMGRLLECAGPSPQFDDLLHNLLYYIAVGPDENPTLKSLKEEFTLDQAFPALAVTDRDGPLTPLNSSVKTALGDKLSVEMTTLLEAVDAFASSTQVDENKLAQIKRLTERLSTTLLVLGQNKLSESLHEVIGQVIKVLTTSSGNLSAVIARLQGIQGSLKTWFESYDHRPAAGDPLNGMVYRVDDAQRSSIRELSNNFDSIKASIVGYVDSQWDVQYLLALPQQFELIIRAVERLGLARVTLIVEQIGSYITRQLVPGTKPPEWPALDALADAITGLECYLDAIARDHQGEQYAMLDLTAQALEKLGFDLEFSVSGVGVDDELVVDTPAMDRLEVEGNDEVDPEIKAIFIEEAAEVLSALEVQYPTWLSDQTDHKTLNELRRGFHTLKGSGRMVQANVIGDLAWAVENMLNKILENASAVVPETVAVLERSLNLIPPLVDDFKRGVEHSSPYCTHLISAAEALAKGEPVTLPQPEEKAVEQKSLEALGVGPLDAMATGRRERQVEDTSHTVIQSIVENFVAEAGAVIGTLGDFLTGFQQACRDSRLSPAQVQRALHILQASAERAGIQAVAEVAKTFTQILPELFAQERDVSRLVLLLRQGVEQLRGVLVRLEARQGEDSVSFQEYRCRVESAREQLQEQKVNSLAVKDSTRLQQLMVAGLNNVLLADILLEKWSDQTSFSRQAIESVVGELMTLGVVAADSDAGALSVLCHQLSRTLCNLADSGEGLNDEALRVCKAAHELLLSMMDALVLSQSVSPAPADLLSQLKALAGEVPRVADAAGDVAEVLPHQQGASVDDLLSRMAGEVHDPDALPFFIEETDDLLEGIESALQVWRNEPNDVSQGKTLNRLLHTFKGSARVAGLSLLGDLSHDLEALILREESRLLDNEAGVFDQLFARYDELVSLVEALKSKSVISVIEVASAPDEPEPFVESLASSGNLDATEEVFQVEAFDGEVSEDKVLESDERRKDIVHPEGDITAISASLKAEPSKGLDLSAAMEVTESVAQPAARAKPAVAVHESVKISAEVLDDLVNLAGEASIARGRVERGVGESAAALDEMEETIDRLRNQVRQLGRQTQAQMQFRREQIESSQNSDFDPLEMDRYSQLQQLSQGLEESGSDLQDLKNTLLEKSQALEGLLFMQSRITQDLQENLMQMRLVPFSRLVPRLRRIVRQVSQELGKEVNLSLTNIEGEMDRSVLEKIIIPIEHMLRNAIDHGIENTAQRLTAGKPGAGNISLSFQREEGEIVISVADDGRGLDVAAIRDKAISQGIITADTQATDSELLRLIFQPGFSTAAALSQVSGRGVGMDVVKTDVHQLGGSIAIESTVGEGVEFTIRLPFTVSVNKALLVKEGASTYALPLNSIVGVTQLNAQELDELYSEPDSQFEYAGLEYQFCALGHLLHREREPVTATVGKVVLILVEVDHYRYAVQVEALEGKEEIINKGLGAQFSGLRGVAGATILASGEVVVILDLPSLLRSKGEMSLLEAPPLALGEDASRAGSFETPAGVSLSPKTIMVVDDSVTVRKVTSRVLEREGFCVVTAKDGIEATDILAQVNPDLMLLDIEMPRMDGFEVARVVRESEHFSGLPLIMISSRTGDKHRQRAANLGVNKFLGKPYQEDELLGLLRELLDFDDT